MVSSGHAPIPPDVPARLDGKDLLLEEPFVVAIVPFAHFFSYDMVGGFWQVFKQEMEGLMRTLSR